MGSDKAEQEMRKCLKQPIREVGAAIKALEAAVDAHLAGDLDLAAAKFNEANCPVTWHWLNAPWTKVRNNVVIMEPDGDTKEIPKAQRDPDRNIASSIKQAVLARDGYRCRYCGLPVVHADIRKIAAQVYPKEIPWNPRISAEQHSAFQVTWLQFDHVEPHSHGGKSSVENVVISCALCNFGKDRFTLRQLDLEDPRLRPPRPSEFDGLERFRQVGLRPIKPVSAVKKYTTKPDDGSSGTITGGGEAFFFPGAYISGGYVNTPPVSGKARWFKLDDTVHRETAIRDGVDGCVVHCARSLLDRRGIDADDYLDTATLTQP
jgi:5-methylcytosine-specific restriction endonuclease McrA